MNQILIYSDSLTWGIIPDTRRRFSFDKRWPGVFEHTLNRYGVTCRVFEDCLNGRRTVWSDPFKAGRNGSERLSQVIEMHSPLKLVILMLGINDFQCTHNNNAWHSAQGMASLINIIKQAPIEPGMPTPDIMLVAPPTILKPKGVIAAKFDGSETRCIGLPENIARLAEEYSVHYFDANSVTGASVIDGIHLDEDQHKILGEAVAKSVFDTVKL